ncbi:SH3 domain-containing protein [Streptomyces beijiangensis]
MRVRDIANVNRHGGFIMKRRLAAFLPVLAAVAVALPFTAATSASASAACGTNVGDKDGSAWHKTANGANERSGSSTGCGSNGIAYSSHTLDYHCYTYVSSTGYTWTYVRNDTTGTAGWIRDDLLSDGGSFVAC